MKGTGDHNIHLFFIFFNAYSLALNYEQNSTIFNGNLTIAFQKRIQTEYLLRSVQNSIWKSMFLQ